MIDVPVQVKDALREGTYRKNYRMVVLNDNGTTDFTIDNNNLVKESVSIDERMNSGDTLKFGLCEGASLEFQYFGMANITGRQLKVFIDVEYGESEPYTIPMGFFTVNKCSRQASTGIIKVTAFNKLQSDYLDAKANSEIEDIVSQGEQGITEGVTYYYLLNKMLEDYAIDTRDDSIVSINVAGEDVSFLNWHGGNQNVAREYAAFRIYKQYASNGTTETVAFYAFKRKVKTINTRPEEDAHSSHCGEMVPREYNRVTFSEMVAPRLRAGFNTIFSEYEDNEDITYYIQPVFYGDVDSPQEIDWQHIDEKVYYQQGAAYKIREVLDSQEELWPTTFNDAYWAYDTYIDSTFKGMVVLDYDTNGAASSNYPSLEIKPNTDISGRYNFIFKQFITPSNLSTSDYFWVDSDSYLDYTTACNCAMLILPSEVFKIDAEHSDWYSLFRYAWNNNGFNFEMEIKHKTISEIEKTIVTEEEVSAWSDITLRELQSAVFETQCQFGQLDRETDLFSGVELNQSKLYPQDTLYPDSSVYPSGSHMSGFKSTYSKLWADEGNVHKWRYLIITYKGLNEHGEEVEKTLQRTIDEHGTDNYNMSDNWLFRNLVWAAEDVGAYADAMVAKMQNITWFPFEMWCAGLPYLETGDEIEIPLGEETYTSYILQRTLKGIQNLQDTYINGTLDIF